MLTPRFSMVQSKLGPPKRVRMPKVESDSNLLVTSGLNSKLRKNRSQRQLRGKFIKDIDSDNGVLKLKSFEPSSNPTFSDEEYNDLDITKSKTLSISELKYQTIPTEYERIMLNLKCISLQDTGKFSSNSPLKAYPKLVHNRALSVFQLFNGQNKEILSIDANKQIEEVLYCNKKILFVFKEELCFESLKFHSALLDVDENDLKTYIDIWNELVVTESLKAKKENVKTLLSRQRYSPGSKDFFDKTLTSLTRNKKVPANYQRRSLRKPNNTVITLEDNHSSPSKTPITTLLAKPTDKDTSTSSLSLARDRSPSLLSSPSTFYAPIMTGRVTRSKTSDSPELQHHITIEDLEVRPQYKLEPFEPSLRYKFKDDITYTIRNSDFQCLSRGHWINDTLIDFFIKYYAEKAVAEGEIDSNDHHLFSTFFYTKLVSKTDSFYENIARWVLKLDLLSKKFVIIPVNEALHWYCCIINNLDALLSDDSKDQCVIYVFDSLAQEHQSVLKPIKSFLIDYAKDKYGIVVSSRKIRLQHSAVPKQPNFNDCGLHVIYNVTKFLQDRESCLKLWNENKSSRSELNSFFKKAERDKMRLRLRLKLKELQAIQEHTELESDHTNNSDEDENDVVIVYSNEQEYINDNVKHFELNSESNGEIRSEEQGKQTDNDCDNNRTGTEKFTNEAEQDGSNTETLKDESDTKNSGAGKQGQIEINGNSKKEQQMKDEEHKGKENKVAKELSNSLRISSPIQAHPSLLKDSNIRQSIPFPTQSEASLSRSNSPENTELLSDENMKSHTNKSRSKEYIDEEHLQVLDSQPSLKHKHSRETSSVGDYDDINDSLMQNGARDTRQDHAASVSLMNIDSKTRMSTTDSRRHNEIKLDSEKMNSDYHDAEKISLSSEAKEISYSQFTNKDESNDPEQVKGSYLRYDFERYEVEEKTRVKTNAGEKSEIKAHEIGEIQDPDGEIRSKKESSNLTEAEDSERTNFGSAMHHDDTLQLVSSIDRIDIDSEANEKDATASNVAIEVREHDIEEPETRASTRFGVHSSETSKVQNMQSSILHPQHLELVDFASESMPTTAEQDFASPFEMEVESLPAIMSSPERTKSKELVDDHDHGVPVEVTVVEDSNQSIKRRKRSSISNIEESRPAKSTRPRKS